MPLPRKLAAEFVGTFWLVLGGCGSAVLAAGFPGMGIGFVGVSLAFGLTVLTMAYAVGHVSGCHLNPVVSVGLWAGKRFPARELAPYIVAQVLGVTGEEVSGDLGPSAKVASQRRRDSRKSSPTLVGISRPSSADAWPPARAGTTPGRAP